MKEKFGTNMLVMLCIALFVVAKGWLLLDIGRFVLFFGTFTVSVEILYTPITSGECHAWFHLNAASPATRNTEQVNLTKNS